MGNVLRHGFGKSSLGDEETLWLSDTVFTQPVNKHNYVKIFKCSDYDKLNPEFEQTPSHRF
jgi:hypothetical protein